MISKIFTIIVSIFIIAGNSKGQIGSDVEKDFVNMKKYVVGIGTIINDSTIQNNKKIGTQRFVTIGSGLITYAKFDTIIIHTVVTARHVINFFKSNNLKSLFIRPSWADTIKTTDYLGVEIPFVNSDKTSNVYFYPDTNIDLGSILLLPIYLDKVYLELDKRETTKVFPFNSMTSPFIGTQVWIVGYPGHIQSQIQNQFFYSIATFKPGYVAWKPPPSITNVDLNHITLIESNASFGNSGGTVFSIQKTFELVGILVAGYEEYDSIYLDNKPLIDPISKKPVLAKSRSGVSIIEKAEYVRKLLEYVQNQIRNYNWQF